MQAAVREKVMDYTKNILWTKNVTNVQLFVFFFSQIQDFKRWDEIVVKSDKNLVMDCTKNILWKKKHYKRLIFCVFFFFCQIQDFKRGDEIVVKVTRI